MWKYIARKRFGYLNKKADHYRQVGRSLPDKLSVKLLFWGRQSGRYVFVVGVYTAHGGPSFFYDRKNKNFFAVDMVGAGYPALEPTAVRKIETVSQRDLEYLATKVDTSETDYPDVAQSLIENVKTILTMPA